MKRKIYFLLALMVISTAMLEAQTKSSEKLGNEVEIDLNSDTFKSSEGVNIKYGNLKLKAFEAQRVQSEGKVYVPNEFFLELDEEAGKMRIDSEGGEFSLAGDRGTFGKSFGYLEVGKVTNAQKPNDRIYFGGERAEYVGNKTYLKNAWFTTDPKILEDRNPENVGYHIKAENITIEPDKQVTFNKLNLNIGDSISSPRFPWYRFNIRQGSEVPLFPEWGTDDDMGWHISTGFLYGDRESKLKGGFAPKFGDQMGFLIGRSETWYDFGKYGESRLNITDWLVHKKRDLEEDPEKAFDRWDINYTHTYSGENGYFDLGYQNVTYNMLPALDDAIDDYFGGRKENSKWDYINDVPNKGGHIEFYNLDTKLTELGEKQDTTIEAQVKLTSDKDVYGVLVADALDDMDYMASKDHDLFSKVGITKDNERFYMNAYYNYLYDMDPGSTKEDLQSRAEDFGFRFIDKKYKIDFSYDEKNGDKFRPLKSWERDPNFSKAVKRGTYDLEFDYTPWTVSQYDIYDSREAKATFGEYKLYGDIDIKTGYEYTYSEKKLNLDRDPFRERAGVGSADTSGKNNIRDKEYNRYENLIYEEKEESRGFVEFIYDSWKATVAGGETREEIWDREGIYTEEAWTSASYQKYINNSNFYELELANDKIKTESLGKFEIFGNVRFDEYDKGYNSKEINTDDSSTRYQFGLVNDVNLYENTYDIDRKIDLVLDNRFTYLFQDYDYDSDKNFNEDLRLRHKENKHQVKDRIAFQLGNTETIYNIDYENIERASTGEQKGERISHKLEFLLDSENTFGLEYSEDKRYTDRDGYNKIDNYNDLTFTNYGANYRFKNNYFYYKNEEIESDLTKMSTINKIREELREEIFGYTYSFGENKLNLEYSKGETDRRDIDAGDQVIKGKNSAYSVSYLDGGDVEQRYNVRYEEYKSDGDRFADFNQYNSDVVYLSYSYADKRFSDQELLTYARAEYNKNPDQLTSAEVDQIRKVLQDRQNSRNATRFNLNRLIDDRVYFGDYKRTFSTSLTLERNEARYDQTGDYFDSLEKLQGRIFASYNRFGLGYIYNQEANYQDKNNKRGWADTEREHEFSLHAKIGKPSEGWRTKAYVKFYDQLSGRTDENARSTFDGFGIEIGKEFGYYEWAIAYERDYSYRTKDYEWTAAIQFRLLTFPDTNIFGIGAKTDMDKKTSPQTYLFDGIEVDDI